MTAGKMIFHPFAGACAFIISTAYVTRLPGQNPAKNTGICKTRLRDPSYRTLFCPHSGWLSVHIFNLVRPKCPMNSKTTSR